MIDFHHPLEGRDNGQDCFLSADLFFCLLQAYRDFLKLHPFGDAIRYYDIYVEVSSNKKVLMVLFMVQEKYENFFPAMHTLNYALQQQSRIISAQVLAELLAEELDPHHFSIEDAFGSLACSAVMLKQLNQAYRIFLYKSQSKVSLRLNRFGLTLFRDGSTFVELTQSWLWINPDDWMDYEQLDGVDDYVIFDLDNPKHTVFSFAQSWRNYPAKATRNRHHNKRKGLAEEKQQESPHDQTYE